MALFIQFHYKGEVYYKRTLQVELTYYKQTVSKNTMLRKLFRVSIKFISKTFSKADPCPLVDLLVHSSLSAEHRQTSILFEVLIKPISEAFLK